MPPTATDRLCLGQMSPDLLQNGRYLFQYLLVGKAQHLQTPTGKNPVPFRIVLCLAVMNISIHLDHEGRYLTVKVHDEAIDHLLPPKMKAAQPIRAETSPQKHLRRRHGPAHLARQLPLLPRMVPQNDLRCVHTTAILKRIKPAWWVPSAG